jgi:tRNA-dihydrouridine synthase
MPNIWLAPLHGLTLYHFRNCLFQHNSGFDAAISPFMPVQESAKLNVRKWKDFAPENNRLVETIPQLMGIVPAHFADTMNALHAEYGLTRFNWNLGCPMGPIVRKRRGCGLMPYPDEVERVVEAACSLPYKFSVKMRLGMHAADEGKEIIRRLNNYPLEFIVIHPRLGEWQYKGLPDLGRLEELLGLTKHRVVYSGDIFQVADYQELHARFPQIDDWMLGRGALRNPFLAEQIKDIPSKTDYHVRFNEFYDDLKQSLVAYRGEKATLPVLKELWHYFAYFYQLTEEQLHSLLVINDYTTFDIAVKQLCEK